MTTDEQTAMQMGAYALDRSIQRIRVLLEYAYPCDHEESEAQVGSERSALAMMNKVLEGSDDTKCSN